MSATLVAPVRAAYATHGYPFADRGAFDLNYFGVRNNSKPGANAFDDVLGCLYREQPMGPLVGRFWRGTTDPGLKYTGADGNARGVAVMVPGCYKGLWTLGQHPRSGGPTAHQALVQVGSVSVYRDADDDGQVDEMGPIDTGLFGINGHRAGKASTRVDGWSAGCQVWARQDDHDAAVRLAKEQVARGMGSTYSYALFRLAEHPEFAPIFAAVGVAL